MPPHAETLNYVRKVLAQVNQVVHPFDASVTDPSPALQLMRVAGTPVLRR